MTNHHAVQQDPGNDMDRWYTQCPSCQLIGPAASAEYAARNHPSDDNVDWLQPVIVGCGPCGTKYTIGPHDLLAHDTEHLCRRCELTTTVPADAAEAICQSCHVYATGPAARNNSAIADTLRATRQAHALQLREILLRTMRQHRLLAP